MKSGRRSISNLRNTYAALLIIIVILVLAIIGLGADTFFSGVLKGVQLLGSLPIVSNAAEKVKQYIHNATEDAYILDIYTLKVILSNQCNGK